MTKGSYSATETDSVIVAADAYRGKIEIQCTNGVMWLGYGVPAVVGEGTFLTEGGIATISDHRAILAIHGICGTGGTSIGGYQTS